MKLLKFLSLRLVGYSNHDLTPKALREKDGKFEICKYIHHNLCNDDYSAIFNDIECKGQELTFDLQQRREFFVLYRFLDLADKSGLNVPVTRQVRKLLHSNISCLETHWPQSRFYEIIALAQHYGLPTCALDWSYDYKVALYFAVKKILENDNSKCVLWAFNYKSLEKESPYVMKKGIDDEKRPQLRFYRPQYHHNSNIKAQKGLFTFLINKKETFDTNNIKPLDEFIYSIVKESANKNNNSEIEVNLNGIKNFTLKNNKKLLYKFVIEGDCKKRILEELYLDGYSEEYLYPGYNGVADAMKNWATLRTMKNKKIMFICNKGTCRSVMAKALFKKDKENNHEIFSSGIHAKNGKKPSKYTMEICEYHGMDISTHKSINFKDSEIEEMNLVFTFEERHKEKILNIYPNLEVYTIKEYIGEDPLNIKEPSGCYKDYERCYDEISRVMKKIKDNLEKNYI